MPWSPGDRTGFRRRGCVRALFNAREDESNPARWPHGFRWHRKPLHGHALSLAHRRSRERAARSGDFRDDFRRPGHGLASSRICLRRRAVPSRVDYDRGREGPASQFPQVELMLTPLLDKIIGRKDLTQPEAAALLDAILAVDATEARI